LLDGALDLALVYRRTPDKRIRLEPLFEDELMVVTAPDHRFADAEYVSIRELADEHLFIYSSLATNRSVVRDILESANVQPRKTTSVQLTEAILELVAAGFGVAVLAKWAVVRAVNDGVVRATRLEADGCRRTWYSAVRSSDVTPAYQFDLIELLRRQLSVGATTTIAAQLRLS
jgi:LysR family transcriptional regulator for metE and metH